MKAPRIILFLAAGGLAAVVNFCSRIVLGGVMPYVPSIVIAYCIGMVTAFLLNRAFVFMEASNPVSQQISWFVLVNLSAVLQTVVISLLFARFLFPRMGMEFHAETIAHGIGVIVPVFTSYLGHKHLTFRGRAAP